METVSFRLEIPVDTHKTLKMKAVGKGKTLSAYLLDILEKAAKKK